MDVIWDGITREESLNPPAAILRQSVADAARDANWPAVLESLSEHRELANSTRPGGTSLYAPLHQAAYGGAPVEVVEKLIGLGAWRTLQNARGERPVDVAERRGHRALLEPLQPRYRHYVPLGILLRIQSYFHDVIRGRAEELVQRESLRLPELEPLLELERPIMWFAVPGMYGGFHYELELAGVEAKLTASSWCRVVEGSSQRHEITSKGIRLVEEGFI